MIHLEWDKPLVDANGDPLTDLTGYKVYASKSNGTWGTPVAVITPPVEAYSFDPPSTGTWYMTVTATNPKGDGTLSNVVSKPVLVAIPGQVQNLRIVS